MLRWDLRTYFSFIYSCLGDYNPNYKTNYLQLFVRCKWELFRFIHFAKNALELEKLNKYLASKCSSSRWEVRWDSGWDLACFKCYSNSSPSHSQWWRNFKSDHKTKLFQSRNQYQEIKLCLNLYLQQSESLYPRFRDYSKWKNDPIDKLIQLLVIRFSRG